MIYICNKNVVHNICMLQFYKKNKRHDFLLWLGRLWKEPLLSLDFPADRDYWFTQPFVQAQIKKTSKRRLTGLCEGNSPVTDEFPVQKGQ